jgi:hypothetical protein
MRENRKLVIIGAVAAGLLLIVLIYQLFLSGPGKSNTVGVPGGVTVDPVPPDVGGGSHRVAPGGG